MNVTIERSSGRQRCVWVTYQTSGGTAASGADFTPASGRLRFTEGQTSEQVTLHIRDDSLPEGPEVFFFNITEVELANARLYELIITTLIKIKEAGGQRSALTPLFCLCRPLVDSDVDYTITETGLQRDQPPAIGDLFSLAVVILTNDNAEGILEFRQDFVDITGQRHSNDDVKLASKTKTHFICECFLCQWERMLAL